MSRSPRMRWALVNQKDRQEQWKKTDTDRGGANRPHAFRIFTMGMDACAICRKTRSEHK